MVWLAITAESDKLFFITLDSGESTLSARLECADGWWWKLIGIAGEQTWLGTTKMHWAEALKRALALMEQPT